MFSKAAVSGAVAAAVAGGVYRALRTRPRRRWQRTNYAGRTVDLYAGPAVALGVAIVAGRGRAGLVAHAAGLVAATVYGDRVSRLAHALADR
jgi:hypothetical protein